MPAQEPHSLDSDTRAVVDLRIVELVARQHGVISIGQLRVCGLSEKAAERRAARGQLHRVYRGVYSLTPSTLVRARGQMLAATLAVGHGAVISMHSAAELHDLQHHHVSNPHVTVPSLGAARRAGIHVHHSTTLRSGQDTTEIDGIPVTTLERTIFDLAGELAGERLERIVDSALKSGELDMAGLQEQIEHNRHRHANANALRKVLASDTIGGRVSWNDFEKSFLALIDEVGLPRPDVRQWLDLDDGEPMIEPDFIWRDLKLIVETDGWTDHGSRKRFETDRHRDQRVAAAGIQAVRVTWRQLQDQRALTGRLLARTVRQRQALFTAPELRRAA